MKNFKKLKEIITIIIAELNIYYATQKLFKKSFSIYSLK